MDFSSLLWIFSCLSYNDLHRAVVSSVAVSPQFRRQVSACARYHVITFIIIPQILCISHDASLHSRRRVRTYQHNPAQQMYDDLTNKEMGKLRACFRNRRRRIWNCVRRQPPHLSVILSHALRTGPRRICGIADQILHADLSAVERITWKKRRGVVEVDVNRSTRLRRRGWSLTVVQSVISFPRYRPTWQPRLTDLRLFCFFIILSERRAQFYVPEGPWNVGWNCRLQVRA